MRARERASEREREREGKQRKVCQGEREIVIMFFSLQATTLKFKQKIEEIFTWTKRDQV